jgi:lipoprotein-anchoring transpeptidase ErfK/SrfK
MRPITWGPASIPKPTYTPSPVPTATATPLPTETPFPTVVIEDTLPAVSNNLDMSYVDAGQQQETAPYTGGKSIMVSIGEQHLYAYDNGQLVYSFVASTGMRNATRTGSFSVLDKIPNAYGSTWDIWMPNWMGIYYAGTLENGIHALPILPSGARLWAGFLGTPISYGCVVLGADESLQLYNWAEVGTPVEIRW